MSLPESAPKKPKLYVGTLFIDRGAVPAYYYSLAMLERSGLVDLHYSMMGHGDGAPRQFNRRVAEFLETDCDYFWLQGNDTDINANYVHHMASSGHKVIAGMFPIKQPELRWCFQSIPGEKTFTDLKTGFLEVRTAGLECIMLHRDALIARQNSRPDLWYADNSGGPGQGKKLFHHWRWELAGPGANGSGPDDWQKRILQSEDYFFCDELRALGFKIMYDTTGYCGHWDGKTRYPLNPPEPAGELIKTPAGEPPNIALQAVD